MSGQPALGSTAEHGTQLLKGPAKRLTLYDGRGRHVRSQEQESRMLILAVAGTGVRGWSGVVCKREQSMAAAA